MTVVEVRNNEITVTPIDELAFPWNLTAIYYACRLKVAAEADDQRRVLDSMRSLMQICIDEPINAETIDKMSVHEVNEIVGVIFTEDSINA